MSEEINDVIDIESIPDSPSTEQGELLIIKDIPSPRLESLEDYHIKKSVDNQGFLTKSWTAITAFVIILPMSTMLMGGVTLEELKGIWSLILTPVMAILGSIAGYYFGKSKIDKMN